MDFKIICSIVCVFAIVNDAYGTGRECVRTQNRDREREEN